MKLLRNLMITVLAVRGTSVWVRGEEPVVLERHVLNLAAARKIVAASEAEARKRGLGVVIAVVDPTGNLIQLTRMDTAQVASVNVGIGKARTSAI